MNQILFEEKLINFVTNGPEDFFVNLKAHFLNSVVSSRKMTGAGFYVDYLVDIKSVRKFPSDFKFGDIFFKTDDLPDGGGVVIYTQDGYLSAMEAFSYSGFWTNGYPGLTLKYISMPRAVPR